MPIDINHPERSSFGRENDRLRADAQMGYRDEVADPIGPRVGTKRACPFCGAMNANLLEWERVGSMREPFMAVKCTSCGSRGPLTPVRFFGHSRDEMAEKALEAWDKRTKSVWETE